MDTKCQLTVTLIHLILRLEISIYLNDYNGID